MGSFAAMSRNKLHFFVARFTVDFAICINKIKTKSSDIYSEEIKRDEVVDIPYKSTFV